MRNRALHDALRAFALEAASLLSADHRGGAELRFDLDEGGRGGPVLYRYSALTGEFIEDRWERLRALPAFASAAGALGAGARSYLRVQGLPGGDPEPALRAMLERLYEDASAFDFPEERFERVYGEVERTLYEGTSQVAVVAPLRGLVLEGQERVELGDGLVLRTAAGLDAPPEATSSRDPGERHDPVEHHPGEGLCAIERDFAAGSALPLGEARVRFRGLVSALRLFKAGAVALGPLAWIRLDGGPWQSFEQAPTGHARGEDYVIGPDEAAELREFIALLAEARPAGTVAWALERFEMGCERDRESDALSDYLLALRALLDGGDETGRATLTLRVAGLCAEESERRAVQRRIEAAFVLERLLLSGASAQEQAEATAPEPPRAVIAAVEGHLRGLLRDLVCGYLDSDLTRLADDILLESSEPIEIRARDIRQSELEPDEHPTGELEPVSPAAATRPATAPPSAAVTPSADWMDEDAGSYSAPV